MNEGKYEVEEEGKGRMAQVRYRRKGKEGRQNDVEEEGKG